MGSGIARVIGKRYPEAKAADKATKYADKEKLGTFSYAIVEDFDRYIFNLYGQYRYGGGGCHLDYPALEQGMNQIKDFFVKQGMLDSVKIGTYKIGCNRGGGEWSIVGPIIERVFPDTEIHIYEL